MTDENSNPGGGWHRSGHRIHTLVEDRLRGGGTAMANALVVDVTFDPRHATEAQADATAAFLHAALSGEGPAASIDVDDLAQAIRRVQSGNPGAGELAERLLPRIEELLRPARATAARPATALAWEPDGQFGQRARTPFGSYIVYTDGALLGDFIPGSSHASPEAAKAAAQRDFDDRLAACGDPGHPLRRC